MVVLKQNLNSTLKNILAPEQLERCLQAIKIIEPSPGELCWNSHSAKTGVYLILEGKARILDLEDNLIISLHEGWFGQITLFPGENFTPGFETWMRN